MEVLCQLHLLLLKQLLVLMPWLPQFRHRLTMLRFGLHPTEQLRPCLHLRQQLLSCLHPTQQLLPCLYLRQQPLVLLNQMLWLLCGLCLQQQLSPFQLHLMLL